MRRVLCRTSKAISRILFGRVVSYALLLRLVIIYLRQALLHGCGELLLTEFWYVFPNFCFVLAPSKDLAVSFLRFRKTYPEGYLSLSASTLLFAPRALLRMAVSHYSFNLLSESGSSDFPPPQNSLSLIAGAITHLACPCI